MAIPVYNSLAPGEPQVVLSYADLLGNHCEKNAISLPPEKNPVDVPNYPRVMQNMIMRLE